MFLPLQVYSVHVEKPFVIVHPDLRHPHGVAAVRVVRNEVRVSVTEDVTDMRTGNGLKRLLIHNRELHLVWPTPTSKLKPNVRVKLTPTTLQSLLNAILVVKIELGYVIVNKQ